MLSPEINVCNQIHEELSKVDDTPDKRTVLIWMMKNLLMKRQDEVISVSVEKNQIRKYYMNVMFVRIVL